MHRRASPVGRPRGSVRAMTPDQPAIDAFVQRYRDQTGDDAPIAGAFCFGDSPGLADELAELVRTGPKRATAGTIVEYEAEGEPLPEPGQRWVVHDGAGQPVVLIETTEVRVGPLATTLDPAFAWDEGEGDRTYEDWLAQHTGYWNRTLPAIGQAFDPDMAVALERFTVRFPDPDVPRPLAVAEGIEVRELRSDERDWAAQVLDERWGGVVAGHGELMVPAEMPALVAVDGTDRIGLLTFRPRPGVDTEVVTIDALQPGRGVGTALLSGIDALARRSGWRRLWLMTTNDNLPALRTYQLAGWHLAALRPGAVERSRALKPEIPALGHDGIAIRDELDLELPR